MVIHTPTLPLARVPATNMQNGDEDSNVKSQIKELFSLSVNLPSANFSAFVRLRHSREKPVTLYQNTTSSIVD